MDYDVNQSKAIQYHEEGHEVYHHKFQRVLLVLLTWIVPLYLIGPWGLTLIPILWAPLALIQLTYQEREADIHSMNKVGRMEILGALNNLPDTGIYPHKEWRIKQIKEASCQNT